MSIWLQLVLFLLALPLSVWTWATLLALRDNAEKLPALVRFTATVAIILGLLLILGRGAVAPAALAFTFTVIMHVGGFWVVRRFCVGVDTRD